MSIDDRPQIVAGDPGRLSPADVERTAEFIRMNRETLLSYWKDGFSTEVLLDRLHAAK